MDGRLLSTVDSGRLTKALDNYWTKKISEELGDLN